MDFSKRAVHERIDSLIAEIAGGEHGAVKLFARKLGAPYTSVHKWVKRGSLPSSEQLVLFHDRLGVNINWLLTGRGAKYLEPQEQVAGKIEQRGEKFYWAGKEVDLEAVGLRLKAARGEVLLKKCADESGVSEHSIKEAEAGRKLPDPRYLYWLAGISYTTADYLITGRVEVAGQGTKAAEKSVVYGRPLSADVRDMVELYQSFDEKGKAAIKAMLKAYKGGE